MYITHIKKHKDNAIANIRTEKRDEKYNLYIHFSKN
jgi:hypothetical protein